MKLEDQVASLELSQKLKELGVKQESEFYWFPVYSHEEITTWKIIRQNEEMHGSEIISAFTVAELGEMLPSFLNKELEYSDDKQYRFKQIKTEIGEHIIYYVPEIYVTGDARFISEMDKNEANARAKTRIYLLENDLIKL